MYPPYKMVIINIILSIIVLTFIYLYFKFFSRKKIHYLPLLILISIVPIISIFRIGTYESGDLSLHVVRTYSFYNILFNEQLLPRWLPEFNVGYGDPHFLFAYFLPYFIGSIFHSIGFSFLDSIKLLLFFSFIASGITMYYWAKDELGEKAGFVSALFYLFAPYHLIDLHFRVTIAETLSFVFLPLLLLLTKKIIHTKNFITIVMFAISYGLLILSHQITSLIFSPILAAYGLFIWINKKKRTYKDLLFYVGAIGLGLLLSAFYWAPIIAGAKYTQTNFSQVSYTPLNELLFSPWRFGLLFQGPMGELSFLIGYTQLFVILAAIYLLLKKRLGKHKMQLTLFFLILFFFLIFMITPLSKLVWDVTPLLKNAQYSYRMLEFVALCTSIIAGVVVTKWNNKVIIGLCFLTVFYTILNWGNRQTIPSITDKYLISEFKRKPDVGMYLEPSSPIWADLAKSNLRIKPKDHIEIISGKAEIKQISRTSARHTYVINAVTDVKLKENTLYFPGWILLVNEEPHPISYNNPEQPGVINFSLKKGLYHAELIFRDTIDRTISAVISIITAIIISIVLVIKFLRTTYRKHQ